MDGAGLASLMRGVLLHLAMVLAPFMGVMMAAALAGHVLQSRPSFTLDKLMPGFLQIVASGGLLTACSASKAGSICSRA